jgi:hypothetical protein
MSQPHMIVFGEAHLRRILGKYVAYYNESRIHRSLNKDAPFPRAIEHLGVITSRPVLGGLHHRYCRIYKHFDNIAEHSHPFSQCSHLFSQLRRMSYIGPSPTCCVVCHESAIEG